MIIKINDDKFDALFRMVKEDSLGSGVTVLILVAYDCDALCACHILTVCNTGFSLTFVGMLEIRVDQICCSWSVQL